MSIANEPEGAPAGVGCETQGIMRPRPGIVEAALWKRAGCPMQSRDRPQRRAWPYSYQIENGGVEFMQGDV